MNKILLTWLAVCSLQVAAHAADRVKIGYPDASGSFLSLPLGQKTGSFQKEGIQADLIRIRSTVALTALVSGELDYHSVLGPAVAAAIHGMPVKIVACYTPLTATAIIALPQFKSIQDLRGKTIAINSLGGGLEGQARLIFKHFGLDTEKDVKLLASGGMESRLTSMKQGLTVATLGSPPIEFVAKKLGFIVLAKADDLFSYPSSGLIVNTKRIKERPDEIKRMIKAGMGTNHYIAHNREGTVQAMMEWMRIDRDTATATYDGVVKTYGDDLSLPEDGIRLLSDEAKKNAKLNREISIEQVADLSLLKEVQKEFRVTGR